MRFKKIAAVVATVGSLTFLAGCGDDTAAEAPQTTAATVPDGFPKDVPVVGTMFTPYDSQVDDAVGMEVVGATATSFDDAVEKLRAAKYEEVLSPGPAKEQRDATFANAKYTVAVSGVEAGGRFRLTYSVIVAG